MKTILCILFFLLPCAVPAQEAPHTCCAASPTAGFAMLANDSTFVTSHLEPAPFAYQSKQGTWIAFPTPDDSTGRAFEIPAEKPTDNVLLVIHEWWGLNDYIRQEAERLRKELGNVRVLALDLYDGKVASKQAEASEYVKSVREERAQAIIRGAIEYVGAKARIGTLGWCFGGGWSLQAALLAAGQGAACVVYYGMPETDTARLASLDAPVLGIFGKQDNHINPEIVAGFEEAMDAAGKELTVLMYDAGHGFANPSSPAHDSKATRDAQKHTIAFLKKHLTK